MSEVQKTIQRITEKVKNRDGHQKEYVQAVTNFLSSIEPVLEKREDFVAQNVVEQLIEPERLIQFKIPWTDDQGNVHVNRGYRVQFNSALGPYKGGLRFHPTVTASVINFLGFEQVLKNSLTGLPIGGGKGGSDFDPKGKSDGEIMRFCQSFMTELQKYLGPDMDIPAGDIGVGHREIGYLFGQYKKINGFQNGVLTGKPLLFGGSIGRTEATGYGLVYFTKAMLEDRGESLEGKRVIVSGSGNVAIYAAEKAQEFGATVIGCSDSNGYVIDEEGLDLDTVKDIKEVRRGRIKEYTNNHSNARYKEGSIWQEEVAYDIALPCATQNEIGEKEALQIIQNGVTVLSEGANMPTNSQAVKLLQKEEIMYAPAKAANAGGVAVSSLEMSQNSQRLRWTLEEVDTKLQEIMQTIFENVRDTAEEYGHPNNYDAGANMAGFVNVAEAMIMQGVV